LLPTGKIDNTYTAMPNVLRYASVAFFRLVLMLERV
jgi:hypothetical protein